jgi:hypothetical protein
VAPGVAILSDMTALKGGEVANITFKFSSAPVGFALGDVTVSGGALSGFTATADPLVYTAVFTPNNGVASGSGAISIASGTFADGSGNSGVGGAMSAISIDTLAPTLSITSSASALNSSATATITFAFSEAPAAFSLGDISATNGVLSNLVQTANPLVYTALFTPAANVAAGTAVVSVATGAYADAAGNSGAAGNSPGISIDTLAPTLAGASLLFSADTGSSSSDLITRTAAQTMAGTLGGGVLAAGDVVEVSLNNGASWTSAAAAAGGNAWSLSGQTLNATGTVQVRVSDSNGNHGTVTTYNYLLDTTAPTVAISSDSSALKAGQSATISFTFSEAPSGFTIGDLIPTGGTLSGFSATANPLVYTVVLTPTPGFNGSAKVTLGNNLYTDTAGNNGSGGSSPTISVDTLAPTLSITSSASALKVGETAVITFTFSDAPSGFALGDITANFGSLSGLTATANPLVYTALYTPTAGTALANDVISVAGSVYADAAGNLGTAANSAAIAIDTLAPTTGGVAVSFSADHGASASDLVTNSPSQIITGTLDNPLVAGEVVQVSLNNGASWLTAVTTGPGSWALTPQLLSGSGTLQVRVSDAAGNTGPAFSAAYVLDLVAPTLVVTSSATTLKAGESATLTFTFSEAPSGFADTDLVAVNGTLSGFTVTANPLVYTAVLTPNGGLAGGSASVTLAPGLYTDVAGNSGGNASSPLITVDTALPVLSITSSAANLKIGESAIITFNFSEAPFGFTLGDISVGGGTLSGFGLTANPLVYTALFTPTPGVGSGSGTISVGAGQFFDAAGNPALLSSLTPISYSTLAPSTGSASVQFGTDNGPLNNDLVTNVAGQTISGQLSANLQAGETVDISLDNGLTWNTAAGATGSTLWTYGPAVLSGSGVLQVRVTDAAGNHGAASSKAYLIDTTAPGATISSNLSSMKAGDIGTLTITFSEVPTGFTLGNLVADGVTLDAASFGVSANPLVYTVQFTPVANRDTPASVSLTAGSYTDLAGNLGLGASSSALTVDARPPGVVITSSAATLKAGETALITFTFSEAPSGFAVGDVSATGGTLSGFTPTANPLVYTVVFTPTPASAGGTAAISVAANVYSDAAGNAGMGGSAPSISFDTLAPLAAASGSPRFDNDTGRSNSDLITSVAGQNVSGTLSGALAAGESVQVSFDDGVTWATAPTSVSGGVTTWSLFHTLTGSGVLRVRVVDAAGNHSTDTVTPYAYDVAAPSVSIGSSAPVANGMAPTTLTLTFSEPPANLSLGMLVAGGGTLGNLQPTANPLVYTVDFTPSPGTASGSASVTISGYTDTAGNTGSGASIVSLQIDTVAPSATAGGVAFITDSGTPGDLITNVAAQTLSGNLSAPLAAGDVVQVSLDNGAHWTTVLTAIGDTSWSIGQTLTGSGVLRVRVVDAAGNASTAYVANYVLDTIAPTVTLSSSGGTVRQGGAATITLTLSDPALLTAADLVVSGGTITSFNGSGSSYTVVITPPVNSTTPITVNLGGGHFSDTAGNGNTAATPLVVTVDTSSTIDQGVPSTVDGVTIHSLSGIDARTGLATRTITVPLITSSRPEDTSTSHATLADIPIGLAASGGNPGTTLVVSLPVGVGFEAAGPSSLLSGNLALMDLIGRIDDQTVPGQATRAAMEGQAQRFLDSLNPATQLQHATLTMKADGNAASAVVMINGNENAATGGANPQHEATPGTEPAGAPAFDATAIALVVDARSLPQGIGLQLDDVDFAAIIGAASVQGGAGKNFFIGDGEAQHIVLSAGADNDILYGNGGDDILVTAAGNDELDGGDGADTLAGGIGNDVLSGGAGNDVLQGGRSDAGQWHFFLKDGKVVGVHQMALASATATETVTAAELNSGVALLHFATGDAARLETLSLLYHAAFDREPDLPGLNFWMSHPELSTQQLAAGFLVPAEATQTLTPLNNHDYVARLLENALGLKPDEAALAPWIARLDAAAAGDITARAGVLADIALSSAHRAAWLSSDGMALGSELLTQEQGWIADSGDDRLSGGAGSDRLVGGDGTDTVVYGGAAAGYMLSLSTKGDVSIVEPDGAHDTIVQIEKGEFNGVTVDLGFTQASAATLQEIGMLYHLTLGRAGDLSGFRFWVEGGLHDSALANGFLISQEFVQRYGGMDDAHFINQLYQNTVQHGASADQLTQWDAYLDTHSRADLVSLLAADVTLVGSQFSADGLSLIGNL